MSGYDPYEAGEPRQAPEEHHYNPIKQPGWREVARKIWAPLVATGAFLLKFGAVLFKLKVFATAGTMLVSIAAYSFVFGWPFAVGFVLLLLVHEMGHVIELRRQGIPASAPLFIPFLGAVVGMKQMPQNAWAEAKVALAGPILGTAGAAAVWVAAEAYDSELLRALAFTGFFLNLFNLLPIVPLDGGRAVAALHPALWLVGLAALGLLTYLHPNPILIIIILFGVLELWRRWQARRAGYQLDYYRVKPAQRVIVAAVYVGIAVACAIGMTYTHVEKSF